MRNPQPATLSDAEGLLTDLGDLGLAAVQFGRSRFADRPRLQLAYYLKKLSMLRTDAKGYSLFGIEPMPPRYFFTAKEGLDKGSELWPAVLDELCELNQWEVDPKFGVRGKYAEAVFTGSIGSAKTYSAVLTIIYQLHLLLCLREPHALFDLSKDTEIVQILQSANADLALLVDFQRMKAMVDGSPWFQKYAPRDRSKEGRLIFRNNIEVRPVSAAHTAALGQNVIGGIIDEINFMQTVKKSSRKLAIEGEFDQATMLYNTIEKRRKSRFMKQGWVPGMLCLVSSKKSPGEFTDRKMDEAKTDPTIYVYDKRHWDVAPLGTYSGEMFDLFVGDDLHKPRILEPGDVVPEGTEHLVMQVPIEVKRSFERDMYDSLRDIAGVGTRAVRPFLYDTDALTAVFGQKESVFGAEWADFQTQHCAMFMNAQDLKQDRWAHVDLGLTGDSAGVAIGYVRRFVEVVRGDEVEGDEVEVLPEVVFDGILEVRPPPGGEINFAKIRKILYALRDLGLPLRWVTYDSYQSTDSLQILQQRGFQTGPLSMDKTFLPYDVAKGAILDRRVVAPKHTRAHREWARLERDESKGKVDHPENGSKDCSDAMAGVIYGLSTRREVWSAHNMLGRLENFRRRYLVKQVEEKSLGEDSIR